MSMLPCNLSSARLTPRIISPRVTCTRASNGVMIYRRVVSSASSVSGVNAGASTSAASASASATVQVGRAQSGDVSDADMAKACECPVCFDNVFLDAEMPKVCFGGHLTCASCWGRPSTTDCPTCRTTGWHPRAPIMFDTLRDYLNFRCDNEVSPGVPCDYVGKRAEMIEHRATCKYRRRGCPLFVCEQNLSTRVCHAANMVQHIMSDHADTATQHFRSKIELKFVLATDPRRTMASAPIPITWYTVLVPRPEREILIQAVLQFRIFRVFATALRSGVESDVYTTILEMGYDRDRPPNRLVRIMPFPENAAAIDQFSNSLFVPFDIMDAHDPLAQFIKVSNDGIKFIPIRVRLYGNFNDGANPIAGYDEPPQAPNASEDDPLTFTAYVHPFVAGQGNGSRRRTRNVERDESGEPPRTRSNTAAATAVTAPSPDAEAFIISSDDETVM
jgi:hypothetical protein